MAYGEQKIKLPPGASLIEEDEVKLPEGATLISDDASKKKVSTVSFGETYSSPELDSETPSTGKIPQVVDMGDGELLPDNPILLSRKYDELKGRKKTIPQVGGGSTFAMGTGSIEIPDEDAVNLSKKIKEYLGDIDPDQISSEFKGVRDEDINIHGEELLADRKENPQLYQRKLGRLKWERGLNEELLKSVESGRLNNDDYNNISASIKSSLENSSVGDYKQQRENVNSVANVIKLFGGENKEQLLKEYATEVSKVYGNSYNFGFEKSKQDSPESKYLITPEAQLGYDYIKDLSPEKAEQYKRLFVDVKSLKDKPEEQKGYNHLMQTLEETGIGLMENSVNEELNSLKTIAEKTGGLTPEQIDKATKLEEKLSELNQKKTELDSKYPDRINDKVDDAIQEILGQNLSWGSYAAGSAGRAFKNTAQGVWEAVSTPFMSDESNRLRELYIMGQSLEDNQVYRKTDANKALVTDTLVIKPELQSQIDAIKNDKTLSREQKELKLYPLLKNNSDKFGRVPIQGGKFNVNPSSILYGVTDLGTTLLPFIALEAATGGIGGAGAAAKFLRTFTAAAATSFHDEYANAILEGKSESDAYKEAMGLTAINSFAMAGAGTPEAVRSMAGLKTSAGKIISRMSDAEIKKVLERGTKSKALNALKDRISATPEMIKKGAESGAKFEVAMNAAQEAKGQLYNTEIDREEQFKHNLLNIANFSLLGGVLGHVGYKRPSNLQKSGLIEFGKNPDGFLASIEQMKKEGALSQADFDQRKGLIEKSAEAYKSLPQLNDKGKPLSSTEQGEILYNTVIKNEGKKAASTLPPQQAEKAEMKSMVADYANGIILENPTDKQLESRKSTLEKQIEGKDENGKPLLPEKELLKAKAQLEAVNNAIEHKQSFDQSVKLEKRDFRKPQGNPEEISQPIELSVEPTTTDKGVEENPALKDIESTAKALEGIDTEKNIPFSLDYLPTDKKAIAEAYHKAKADGSNPELVKAVEQSLSPTKSEPTVKEEAPTVSDVSGGVNKIEGLPIEHIDENGNVVKKVSPEPIEIITETQPTNEAKAKASTVSGSALKDVGDVEYNDFIDKGKVSDERLNDIAEKVKTQQPLSDREMEIFSDKTGGINKIIADSKNAKGVEVKPNSKHTGIINGKEATISVGHVISDGKYKGNANVNVVFKDGSGGFGGNMTVADIQKAVEQSKAPTQYTEAAGGSALKDVGKGEPLNTNEEAKLKELYKKSFLKQEMTPQEQQEFVDLKNKKNEFKRKQALDNQLEEGANVNGDWVSIHSGGYKKMGLFYRGENWEVNIQNRLNNNILTIRKRNPKTGELEIIHQSDHKTEQGAIEEYKKHNKGIEDEINARFDDQVEKPQAPTQSTEASTPPKKETSGVSGSALKDVESTAKALEGVDELKSEKGFSFVGNKKLKGEKHKGLNFDELINRLATDFFGTYGVAKSKSTIESEIDALERLLMRPDTFKYEPKKAKPFEEQLKLLESYRDKGIKNVRDMLISEAYHQAKADGSNPELVAAVEQLLGKPKETSTTSNSKGEGTGTTTEVKEPTITEPNKVGEEAETAVKKEEQPPIVPPITPLTNTERSNEGELRDKGVLASMHKSVPESAKSKVDEKGLKYRVASQAEAKAIATQILEDNGVDIAIEYASNAKLDGDVRSMLYNVSLNKLAEMEKAETNETAKKEIANKYADTLIDYDEMGRDAGRFNSAIFDFYKSPLGMEFYENKKRDNAFKKEQTKNGKSWDEFYEEFKDEPEFGAMVQAEILKEKMKKPGFAKKAADSLRKKADGILKNGITPDWLKADVKDAKTKGIDAKMVDKAIAKALKIIADAIEVGGNIANVIAAQVQKIKELGVSAKDSEIAKWLYKESGATGTDAKTFEDKVKAKIESLVKTIKKLEEKLANKEYEVGEKESITNDEIAKLEEELKGLRKELEQKRKEAKVGKYSDESKVAAAEKAAQKNIEELEDKIANNDLEFDKIEKPTSPQLDAYREKQKALRKELEQKRKEAKVGKYSDESRIKDIEERIAEYNRKKDKGEYVPKTKEKLIGEIKDANEKLKEARKAYYEARKNFPAYKAKMSERYLDRMRKKLKGLNEKQQREVIEQSFRKLAENGALDQADFREIIKNTLGLGKLDKAEADVMKSYVEDINAVDDARKNFVNENGSPESEKKLNDAEMKALKSKQELATIVHTQTDVWNTVRAAMQLTAIGVPTILKNFAWNFVQQGLIKFPANAIISLADASVSKAANILNLPYSRTTSLFGVEQGYFFKNMKKGIKEGVLALKYGINSKDYFDKEVYTKPIQPVKNAKELLDWAKGNSKLKAGEVLDKAIKASPTGYYMDMVSRGLTFFDKPLRYAAEGGTAARIGSKELGLSGQQLNVFTRSPKEYAIKHFQSKGDDIATATKKAESIVSRITESGDKSVAQQANMLSDAFNNFGRFIKDKTDDNVLGKNIVGAGKVALTPVTLFIKTPANVAWQVFNLINPSVALAQSAGLSANAYRKFKNGDVTYKQDLDRAKDWMGTAVVGVGMGMLGQFLSGIGVVESGEDEDTKKKERDATKQYSKKFTFNYSKFNRYIQGIPDSPDDEDLRIDLSWYGQLGAMMDLKERMRKLKQDEPDMSDLDMAMNEFSESSKIAMSSSVLNSASALSQAFTSYDGFKGYGVNSINTMANIIHPQALAQHSRAELDNEYQVKADSFLKQLDNSFAARSSLYRKVTGHYPPSDIGIWGDEMKKGGSAGLRYFGISRDNKNPFAKEIYDDAERTGNLDFLPSSVKNSITKNGETVKLPTEAARYLEQQVGTERKKLITAYIDGALTIPGYGKYNTLTDQKKIEALSVIYKAGYDKGKYDFYQKYPQYNNEKTKKEKSDDKKESYQKKVLKNAINKKYQKW